MSLTNPDARRALRAVVDAAVAFVILALVAWVIHLVSSEGGRLERIALALIVILVLGTIFYGAENVTRAVKLSVGKDGVTADIGATQGADAVAEAASDKRDEIKAAVDGAA